MAKLAEQESIELNSQSEATSPSLEKSSQTKSNLKEILNKLHHLDPSQTEELKELFSKFKTENPNHRILNTLSNRMDSRLDADSNIKIENSVFKLSSESTISPSEKDAKEIMSSIKEALRSGSPNHDNIIKLIGHLRDNIIVRDFNKNIDSSLVQDFKNSGASSEQITKLKEIVSELKLTGHALATVRG